MIEKKGVFGDWEHEIRDFDDILTAQRFIIQSVVMHE